MIFIVILLFVGVVITGGEYGRIAYISGIGLLALIILGSIISSFICNTGEDRDDPESFNVRMIIKFMGLFFLTGSLLSFIGLYLISDREGFFFTNIEMVLRSMLYSIDLFILDLESSIIDRLDHFPVIKALIVIQAFISFICTLFLVLNIIYYRLKSFYNLYHANPVKKDKNHIYLFWGINRVSSILSLDVFKNDPKAIIIFVVSSEKSDDDGDIWTSLLSVFSSGKPARKLLRETKALVAQSYRQLYEIEQDPNDTIDIMGKVGLKRLKKFINKLKSVNGSLYAFFLSDNDNENVRNVMSLVNDYTVASVTNKDDVDIRLYCKAALTDSTRTLEELAISDKLSISIVDPAYLSVEIMKSKPEYQPVQTVHLSVSNPTTVVKPFEALILGFNDLGKEFFSFLYEFGVFLKEDSNDEQVSVCYPIIAVADENIDEKIGSFIFQRPGIDFNSENIRLKNISSLSTGLFDEILSPKKCRTINYIVLTGDDDTENIDLGVLIFNHIRKYREDMSNLRIMVRCMREENMVLAEKIASYYNSSCSSDDIPLKVLNIYGNEKDIYNYRVIIKEDLEEQGKQFYKRYGAVNNENTDWTLRRQKVRKGINDKTSKAGIKDRVSKLRRQEKQDLTNAFHANTKLELLERTLGPQFNWENFFGRLFEENGRSKLVGRLSTLNYPDLSEDENRIMRNLAMLEHERWNASHLLLGYVPTESGSVDERTKAHNCIRSWEELDVESEKVSTSDWQCDYKRYDYNVVETTLSIWKNILLNR